MRHFKILPNLLPEDDPRYIKWKESLKKRPIPWNKGYTKENNEGLARMSRTFKKKRIDNFKKWRDSMKEKGFIGPSVSEFKKDGDLAELRGVVLGDGYIGRFPRTELLAIFSNSNNTGFVYRYAGLVQKIFRKEPRLTKINNSNCIKISIYQKDISKRLGLPAGARKNKVIKTPDWIWGNTDYLKRYLRGLYEAEGSFCVHKPTYTYKFLFSNRNKSLLDDVYRGLQVLGFHPHRSRNLIQISKKKEVYKVKSLLHFRKY